MLPPTIAMIVSVTVMLLALWRKLLPVAGVAKVCASLSFIWLALAVDAEVHALGRVILGAFGLSLLGDVALLGKSPKWLSLGIFAFLSAHAAFIVAFVVRGVNVMHALIGFVCVLPVSLLLARWVLKHASADMRPKVIAYVSLITVMVATAAGTISWLLLAAVIFYVSDICVARHRFVKEALINRLIGLPLYYGAQWMFALAASFKA